MKFNSKYKTIGLQIVLIFSVVFISEITTILNSMEIENKTYTLNSMSNIRIKRKIKQGNQLSEAQQKDAKCINVYALAPLTLNTKPKATSLPNVNINYDKIDGEFELFNKVLSLKPESSKKKNEAIYTTDKNVKYTYLLERILAVNGKKNDFRLVFVHKLTSNFNRIYPYNTLNIVFNVIEKPAKGKQPSPNTPVPTKPYIDDMLDSFTTEGSTSILKIADSVHGNGYFSYAGTSAYSDCVQNSIWIQINKDVVMPSNKIKSVIDNMKSKIPQDKTTNDALNDALANKKQTSHNWRILTYYNMYENDSKSPK